MQMLAREFFFSFSLLAYAGILMTIGIVLLLDAGRRFAVDAYRAIRPKVNTEPVVIPTTELAKKPEEKRRTLEEAA
jgi:hypothetical protein